MLYKYGIFVLFLPGLFCADMKPAPRFLFLRQKSQDIKNRELQLNPRQIANRDVIEALPTNKNQINFQTDEAKQEQHMKEIIHESSVSRIRTGLPVKPEGRKPTGIRNTIPQLQKQTLEQIDKKGRASINNRRIHKLPKNVHHSRKSFPEQEKIALVVPESIKPRVEEEIKHKMAKNSFLARSKLQKSQSLRNYESNAEIKSLSDEVDMLKEKLSEAEYLLKSARKDFTNEKSDKLTEKSKKSRLFFVPERLFKSAVTEDSIVSRSIHATNIDNINVPKFSKMIKNTGVNLLSSDSHSILAEDVAKSSLEKDRKEKSLIQGFKIRGDRSNRIIFIDVAKLGISSLSSKTLKVGNSELIPVDLDSTKKDNISRRNFMNRDALHKMTLTHLHHKENHEEIPRYKSPLQVSSDSDIKAQTASRRLRKQPVQFFNKFDDGNRSERTKIGRKLSEPKPNERKIKSNYRKDSFRIDNFSSFPQQNTPNQLIYQPKNENIVPSLNAEETEKVHPQISKLQKLKETNEYLTDGQRSNTINLSKNTEIPHLNSDGRIRYQQKSTGILKQSIRVSPPGIDEVLKQQAELISLQQKHKAQNDLPDTLKSVVHQRETVQQPSNQVLQQPYPRYLHQPIVEPGLQSPEIQEVLRQEAKIIELQQQNSISSQVSNSRVGPKPQFSSRVYQIPGLAEHAKYVAELQSAQNALVNL